MGPGPRETGAGAAGTVAGLEVIELMSHEHEGVAEWDPLKLTGRGSGLGIPATRPSNGWSPGGQIAGTAR